MVNKELLDKYIDMAGIKKKYLCDKMGISMQAYSDKVNEKYPFSEPEKFIISTILHLSYHEQELVFGAKNVK